MPVNFFKLANIRTHSSSLKLIRFIPLKMINSTGLVKRQQNLETFEYIKKRHNTLAHEMLTFASSGVDFNVAAAFNEMMGLLKKIEIWWFENLKMATDPEAYPGNLDLDEVIPGPVWSLQMHIDVALGPEEETRK
jgi:hypothetical protein